MISCFVTWKLKTEDSKTFQQVFNGQFPCDTYLRGNHSSCNAENKYSVQDDDPGDNEYNYYDSLQARLIQGIAHCPELIHYLYITPRVP